MGKPTQISRRWFVAANRIARAGTSGWYTGGTGIARRPSLFIAQSNCGVFTAGRCTIVSWMSTLSCSSSERSASVKPRIANLAPQ